MSQRGGATAASAMSASPSAPAAVTPDAAADAYGEDIPF